MSETTPEILERLVAFPSVFTAADYSAIADYAVDHLTALGFTCHRMTGETPGRAGLFASLGPPGPGGVMLSAHLDVVPVEGQAWTTDPFRLTRRDGRLHGRGTTDMKGFAAAALSAAGRAARRDLKRPLKLALSYDEEAGCVGMAEMIGALERTVGRPDCCIVGEPTSMRVATGHKGKVSYRVRCLGEAGHSASAPLYANALHLACDVVQIIRRVQQSVTLCHARDPAYDVPYSTLHVGRLSGGTALNIVPDAAELEFEIRHLATDPPERMLSTIRADIDAVLAETRRGHPDAAVKISLINAYPGLETPANADVTEFALSLGGLGPTTKVSYGTEAGFFQRDLGVPTIVCGPGDMAQGHKADEFVAESQLAACDSMLDRLIDHLAG